MFKFQPARKRSLRAFTLIEMLVVLALIGILTLLIVPAISASRNKAATVACASNLSQWGKAMVSYITGRGNGYFPSDGYVNGRIVKENSWAWYNVLPLEMDMPALKDLLESGDPLPRPGDRSVWICNAVPSSAGPSSRNETSFFFCYTVNRYVKQGNGLENYVHYEEVPYPAQFVAMGERDVEKSYWIPNVNPNTIAYRHDGGKERSNLLFADGHVETFPRHRIYVEKSDLGTQRENRGLLWNPEFGIDPFGSK